MPSPALARLPAAALAALLLAALPAAAQPPSGASAAAAPAQVKLTAADEAVVKPIRTVFNNVRFGRDLAALKQFATEAQGRTIMGAAWEQGTPAQRKEFQELFAALFAKIAFPRVREDFKNLAQVTYDAPKPDAAGDRASVGSTVLILHALKKQEIRLTYSVVKEAGAWKVHDVKVLGASMLEDVRLQADQLHKQAEKAQPGSGFEGVLAAMRKEAEKYKSVKLK